MKQSICPNCKKILHCGCLACIERNRTKIDEQNTLIVWKTEESQVCCSCGLHKHCDYWLPDLHLDENGGDFR